MTPRIANRNEVRRRGLDRTEPNKQLILSRIEKEEGTAAESDDGVDGRSEGGSDGGMDEGGRKKEGGRRKKTEGANRKGKEARKRGRRYTQQRRHEQEGGRRKADEEGASFSHRSEYSQCNGFRPDSLFTRANTPRGQLESDFRYWYRVGRETRV